jgi:type I restriction enzyme, R subunit
MKQTNEAAFGTVIKTHLLANCYVTMNRDGFDREWAIFPEAVLAFIRTTQPKEWVNLYARRQDAPLSCSRSVVPCL